MAIYCRLSTILGEKRMKMAELARKTGLAKGTVHTLYHDRVTKIDYRVLDKLCAVLDITPGDLLKYRPGEKEDEEKK